MCFLNSLYNVHKSLKQCAQREARSFLLSDLFLSLHLWTHTHTHMAHVHTLRGCVSQCFHHSLLYLLVYYLFFCSGLKNCQILVRWDATNNTGLIPQLRSFTDSQVTHMHPVLSQTDSLLAPRILWYSARLLFPAPVLSHYRSHMDSSFVELFLTSFGASSHMATAVTCLGLNAAAWIRTEATDPVLCPFLFKILVVTVGSQPCSTHVLLCHISGFSLWARSVLLLDKASERCFRGNWIRY